jgi:prepilin-type N-terminal cleavage/methylation domain-containing protein
MKQGFTLIEVLVAIGILLIMFTGGLISYRTAARNQALEADSAKIIQTLREAQSNIKNGKKINCVATLEYWQVRLDGLKIYLDEVCNGVAASTMSFDLSNTVSTNTVKFYPLSAGASPATITIGTKTITVSNIGDIR